MPSPCQLHEFAFIKYEDSNCRMPTHFRRAELICSIRPNQWWFIESESRINGRLAYDTALQVGPRPLRFEKNVQHECANEIEMTSKDPDFSR